jgi:hypothetical protein
LRIGVSIVGSFLIGCVAAWLDERLTRANIKYIAAGL